MSKLKQFNGRFCEYDFENVFIQYLEDAGWTYQAGDDISRTKLEETLILDDLKSFLKESNPDLPEEDIAHICDTMRLLGGQIKLKITKPMKKNLMDVMINSPSC